MSQLSRRSVLKCGVAGMVAVPVTILGQADPRKWAAAPDAETGTITNLIDDAAEKLKSGASVSDVLADPRFMQAHPYPRFRKTIREHADSKPLSLCGDSEPGERAVLHLQCLSKDGVPLAGALVYIYHTSSQGWYAAEAFHVRAQEGDRRHARLFGYARTNQNGHLEVKTIRPAGYPDGNLPAHFHVEIVDTSPAVVTEILFSDDPRLTPDARKRALAEGFVVSEPKKGPEGWWRIRATLKQRG